MKNENYSFPFPRNEFFQGLYELQASTTLKEFRESSKNPDEATLMTNFDTTDLPLYQKCVELYQKQYKDCPFNIKQEAYDCRGNLLHSSMSLHIDSHSNYIAAQQFHAIYEQERQKFVAAQSKIAEMLYEKAQRNLPSQFEVRLYDNDVSGHYLYVHRHFSDLEAGVTFTPSYEDQPVKVMFWEGENVLSRQEFTDITQANSRAKQALQDIVAAVKDDKKIPDRTLSHDEH